jgi:hydrogenase large subunit
VSGALGVQLDTDGDSIADAWVSGNFYRGYEQILQGRDGRDIVPISSRICGWCGAVHQTTASIACEMAWGITPPPMAVALRSVAECTEAIWIHAAHLATRAGPDYCAPVMAATSPSLWAMAERTSARGAAIHGYESIGELMQGLTPGTGRYWTETLPAGRRVQEMINLMYGKFPHPSVVQAGTVGQHLTWANFTEYYTRLYMSVDYVKQVCALWDDLIDFLLEADPRFAELGERPANLINAGAWDDVRSSYSYDALDATGKARLARPGVIVNGEVVEDRLTEINRGIQEDVEHSYFDAHSSTGTAPDGADLPPGHPWLSSLTPRPGARDLEGRYSWATAPRWRDQVVETGPLGRLWLTATREDFPENDFIQPTGTGVKILIPMNFQPEMTVEWKIPQRVNALERLRADAYGVAFAGLCAALALLKGFELMRAGETAVSVPLEVSGQDVRGVGLWDSGRGMNAHWMHTEGGKVTGYQVIGPSTWNASPRDSQGRPGPLEEALIGSPILSEGGDRARGMIDAARVIHSFDPCMNCGTQ